jgi:hypothetical protein
MGLQLIQARQWLKTRRADIDLPEQRFIEKSRRAGRLRLIAGIVAFVLVSYFVLSLSVLQVYYYQNLKTMYFSSKRWPESSGDSNTPPLEGSLNNVASAFDFDLVCPFVVSQHEKTLSGLPLTSDEQRILSWSYDHTVRSWNVGCFSR